MRTFDGSRAYCCLFYEVKKFLLGLRCADGYGHELAAPSEVAGEEFTMSCPAVDAKFDVWVHADWVLVG